MRVSLGQFNAVVGDLAGNAARMREMYSRAVSEGSDLLIFPELAICGYPPGDLLCKKHFISDGEKILNELASGCTDLTMIVGFAQNYQGDNYNSAAVVQSGRVLTVYRKRLLADYGVFDERRYFRPGDEPVVVNVDGFNLLLTIGRDIRDKQWLAKQFDSNKEIDLVVNISASWFDIRKSGPRHKVLDECAKKLNCGVCYCNLVGGQDELVFDGRSAFVDTAGTISASAKAFEEDFLTADIARADGTITIKPANPVSKQPAGLTDEIYRALVLGVRDYTRKNGFERVLVGISGGIDSSVVAAIAVDAMGKANVTGVSMPTQFNSPETIADAEKVAGNLGIRFLTIPIDAIVGQYDKALAKVAGWDNKQTAFENLQARVRGCILMSLSNQFGSIVLASGNKSETAVGYCTLYGDTAGGFSVIKDVLKTMVYELAEYINAGSENQIIPASVIERSPSAELRAGQKDTDALPDYELLDKILKGYVEENKSPRELVEAGLPDDIVLQIVKMVDKNEYKRRQSPPGVRISTGAFGQDRRFPITNRYSHYINGHAE